MTMPAAFAGIARAVSARMDGPFADAVILDAGAPSFDEGGSIAGPGTPAERACSVQIDLIADAMRGDAGFAQGDARFLILSAGLDGAVGTDARVRVLAGPHAGLWTVSALEADPAGIGWVGRGRHG
ncbi:MAG: hypothetical protein ACO1O3_16260 [Sphingobium sp.]